MNDEKISFFSEFELASKKLWKEATIEELSGAEFEKKMIWTTLDNIKVEPLYVADDIKDYSYIDAIPCTYSSFKKNLKSNDWIICQTIIVNEDIKEANKKAKLFIEKGVQAIEFNIKYFLNNNNEVEQLLDGIDFREIKIHFSGFHSYSILLQLLKWYFQKNNIRTEILNGSFNFDCFSYYLINGQYYNSLQDNLNELHCLIKETSKYFPNLKIITINGHLFHNSGGSITQELAFTLSAAYEYLIKLIELGLTYEEVVRSMRFSFAIGSSFFMEIAKIRSARLLWAHISKHFADNATLLQNIEIHSVSSLWNKTIYDAHNNILRATTEAMSASLGGSDSINILPFDITYKEPDEYSEHIARNIQHILKEEAFFTKTIDPAAGSYYIEKLTASLSEHAWKLFEQIEEMGGFIQAMESGFIVDEIQKIAKKQENIIAQRRQTIIGINQYPNLYEKSLEKIKKNTEITTNKDSRTLNLFRCSQAYEELRLRTEKHVANGGKQPVVYLLPYGNLSMRVARMQFSTNFFGLASFKVIEGTLHTDISTTLELIKKYNTDIVVICSSDSEYAHTAGDISQNIKNYNQKILVIIAGNPTELIPMLREAKVDDFINIKTNALESLSNFQKKLGII